MSNAANNRTCILAIEASAYQHRTPAVLQAHAHFIGGVVCGFCSAAQLEKFQIAAR
jgi:hypothetical protein